MSMIFAIVLRPLALSDLSEAYQYYKAIREELGEDFLNELQVFLDKLEKNPFMCSFIRKPIRQGKVNRYPYNVVYEVIEDKILVYSIFMAKQSPDKKRTF